MITMIKITKFKAMMTNSYMKIQMKYNKMIITILQKKYNKTNKFHKMKLEIKTNQIIKMKIKMMNKIYDYYFIIYNNIHIQLY